MPGSGSGSTSSSRQGASPTPTTTPMPGSEDAARTETELAGFAAAIRHRLSSELRDDDKRLLDLLVAAHRAHVDVLHQSDPSVIEKRASNRPSPTGSASADESGTPTSSSASARSPSSASSSSSAPASRYAVGSDPSKAVAKLRALEKSAAGHHRDRALDPRGPDDRLEELTLLWGSLSTAASSYAATLTDGHHKNPKAAARRRDAVRMPETEQAVRHLVSQLDATIFGFQTALGRLSGKAAARARARLAEYRRLRDTTRVWLTEHKSTVPDQKAAYRLPVQPEDASTAIKLIVTIEDRMLPYLGQWLATAGTSGDRKTALKALDACWTSADSWSASAHVPVWPGWPLA